MKQMKLELEKGVFIFYYYDNSKDLNSYNQEGSFNPIMLDFIPKIEMTELLLMQFIEEISNYILDKLKNIISENKLFYENFELNLNSKFSCFSLYRSTVNRNLLLVSNARMTFEHKLLP